MPGQAPASKGRSRQKDRKHVLRRSHQYQMYAQRGCPITVRGTLVGSSSVALCSFEKIRRYLVLGWEILLRQKISERKPTQRPCHGILLVLEGHPQYPNHLILSVDRRAPYKSSRILQSHSIFLELSFHRTDLAPHVFSHWTHCFESEQFAGVFNRRNRRVPS